MNYAIQNKYLVPSNKNKKVRGILDDIDKVF